MEVDVAAIAPVFNFILNIVQIAILYYLMVRLWQMK